MTIRLGVWVAKLVGMGIRAVEMRLIFILQQWCIFELHILEVSA